MEHWIVNLAQRKKKRDNECGCIHPKNAARDREARVLIENERGERKGKTRGRHCYSEGGT